MILGIFVIIYMFINILFSVLNRKKIMKYKENADLEYVDMRNSLQNFKKKNTFALLVSAIITIMIFTLPVSLIIILYLHFPVRMFFGQVNLILTYLGLMSIIIVFDIMRVKILNGYIVEANNEGSNIKMISIKENIICNLLNPLNSGLYAVLVIAMFILLK